MTNVGECVYVCGAICNTAKRRHLRLASQLCHEMPLARLSLLLMKKLWCREKKRKTQRATRTYAKSININLAPGEERGKTVRLRFMDHQHTHTHHLMVPSWRWWHHNSHSHSTWWQSASSWSREVINNTQAPITWHYQHSSAQTTTVKYTVKIHWKEEKKREKWRFTEEVKTVTQKSLHPFFWFPSWMEPLKPPAPEHARNVRHSLQCSILLLRYANHLHPHSLMQTEVILKLPISHRLATRVGWFNSYNSYNLSTEFVSQSHWCCCCCGEKLWVSVSKSSGNIAKQTVNWLMTVGTVAYMQIMKNITFSVRWLVFAANIKVTVISLERGYGL